MTTLSFAAGGPFLKSQLLGVVSFGLAFSLSHIRTEGCPDSIHESSG